jgi:hypothetical protein
MTYKDYWFQEVTRGLSSQSLATMYEFGLLAQDRRRMLQMTTEEAVNEIENLANRYNTGSGGNFTNDNMGASFIPVNGLPWYWMLGDSSPDGAVHTVTNKSGGYKPSIAAYLEGKEKYEAFGNVAMKFDVGMAIGLPVSANMSFMGMTHGRSTATVSSATYPSSIESPFTIFDSFTWDGDAFDLKSFSCSYTQKLNPLIGSSGFYQSITDTAPIIHVFTAAFKADEDCENIIADKRSKTAKTLVAKVLKSDDPTKYWEHSVSMICKDLQLVRIQDDIELNVGIFVAVGACTENFVDGVADEFYGD